MLPKAGGDSGSSPPGLTGADEAGAMGQEAAWGSAGAGGVGTTRGLTRALGAKTPK
jgi:hypothetical protein